MDEKIKLFLADRGNFAKFQSNSATADEKKLLVELYERVLRVKFRENCSSCYLDAYTELAHLYKQNAKNLEARYACKYRLKNGVVLQIFGKPDAMVTNKNITNALAERHLRENPECAALFAVIPVKEAPDTPSKEFTIAELALIEKLITALAGGATKKELLAQLVELETVGDKPLTNKLICELIDAACAFPK